MFATLQHAGIKKIAVALPTHKVSYDTEVYEGVDEIKKQKLKSIIGFNQRFVAQQETTLDLCEAACIKLNIDFAAIDALIFITQTPDNYQPGNSYVLHGRLDLKKDCLCIDINAGCNGYVQGLFNAEQLLQQEEVNTVLVCAGDTISKIVNPSDATLAPIFGDGGSATLLTKMQGKQSYYSFHSNGKLFDRIIQKKNDDAKEYLFMDGASVMQMAIGEVPKSIEALFEKYRISSATDYYFFHQANNFIVETLAKNLNLPMQKIPLIFSEFGNQSSASIPFAIHQTLKRVKAGQCLLSGFGVGFAWANAIVDLSELEVIE